MISARAGKRLRNRDYPTAVVSCADSWGNYANAFFAKSGKVDFRSYQNTPDLETALNGLGRIGGVREG